MLISSEMDTSGEYWLDVSVLSGCSISIKSNRTTFPPVHYMYEVYKCIPNMPEVLRVRSVSQGQRGAPGDPAKGVNMIKITSVTNNTDGSLNIQCEYTDLSLV